MTGLKLILLLLFLLLSSFFFFFFFLRFIIHKGFRPACVQLDEFVGHFPNFLSIEVKLLVASFRFCFSQPRSSLGPHLPRTATKKSITKSINFFFFQEHFLKSLLCYPIQPPLGLLFVGKLGDLRKPFLPGHLDLQQNFWSLDFGAQGL